MISDSTIQLDASIGSPLASFSAVSSQEEPRAEAPIVSTNPIWSTVSRGLDGESFINLSRRTDVAVGSELRVLDMSRWSADRLQVLESQLSKLAVLGHASVRTVIDSNLNSDPATMQIGLPAHLHPTDSQLAKSIDRLTAMQRLQVASQIVDVMGAAHRLGVFCGGLSPQSVLIDIRRDGVKSYVDLTGVRCDAPEGGPAFDSSDRFTLEHDLRSLQTLFIRLLTPAIDDEADSSGAVSIGGRQRGLMRRMLTIDDTSLTPSLGQWAASLAQWLPQEIAVDATGIIAPKKRNAPVELSPTDDDSTSDLARGESPKTNAESMRHGGETLGRFRLIEKIGSGGMGEVYRATDMADGSNVAVKVLRNTGKNVAHSIRRFHKEARLLADAQNDHVTRLIEVGEDNGRHFLAMELIEGIDLKSWFAKQDPLCERDALTLVADISRALIEAHASEVVHRDIKPENVMLQWKEVESSAKRNPQQAPLEKFRIKLTDFGIARHITQTESMEVTQAGAILGTPRYMSPEQCKSTSVIGPSADIYSIGITLFELLTGATPFQSDDVMKLAAMHCFDEAPSVQKKNAEISDGTARLVSRMLAKDPAKRFGDAGQLLSEIMKILCGDATDVDAHPKLPEHSPSKLWQKSVTWDLQSTPQSLWPFVSNTERLNHAIGLPAVEYRTVKDPELGLRKFGSFRMSGVRIAWEEHPFEWIEGSRMGILREFESGPLKWFLSVVTLESLPGGGTRLAHQVRIEPRNVLGRVITTVEADWKGFKNLDRVYRRIDQNLIAQNAAAQTTCSVGHDVFEPVKKLSRTQASRLDRGIDRMAELGVDVNAANAISSLLREFSAQDVAHLRPISLAQRYSVKPQSMIDACLVASHCGLLTLRWDVLCPTCRVASATMDKLSEIQSHTNCEACDIDFRSNVGEAIEMVFRAHPEIREVNDSKYCVGGPEHAPHVVSQLRLESGERISVSLDLDAGNYLIRGARFGKTQPVQVRDSSAPSQLDLTLSKLGEDMHVAKLRTGRQTLVLNNDLSSLHIVKIERTIPRNDVVTASAATAMPRFRELFPDQNFSPENPVASEQIAILATAVDRVDDLYRTLGDADAYSQIQQGVKRVVEVVSNEGGTVIKTIGDRVMAVFLCREQAVKTALRIRQGSTDRECVSQSTGVVVHFGSTLVTTQNNQLDYFGGTIQTVMSLIDKAGIDIVLTEQVYVDPGVRDLINDQSNSVIETISQTGISDRRIRRIKTTGKAE